MAISDNTRLGQLIPTIFALYGRTEGNWLSVAAVVELMADLGADSQAVRSSVSRLKRRGVLDGERRGGAAGYSLTAATLAVLAEGDVRIFERARATEPDGWLVVVFSVPESERDKRHALRSSLTRPGFGTAAPGVWVAPGSVADETRHTLERRELTEYVDLFAGEHLAFGDLRSKVREWWDLDELTALYAHFLHRYRPVRDRVAGGTITPQEASALYLPMLTEWRRLPYRDPGIPLSLLPPDWNGVGAGELFGALNDALGSPARDHAVRIIGAAGTSQARLTLLNSIFKLPIALSERCLRRALLMLFSERVRCCLARCGIELIPGIGRWIVAATVIGDIALVLVVSSLLGAVARRFGQPTVIGQILTGVLLGPSLLGRLPGHLTAHLFPHAVLPSLTSLAQVAVVTFMFTVGYELNVSEIRGRGKAVPLLAATALLVPMSLGIACVLLYRPGLAAVGEPRDGRSFVLFMGVAMSITAMPVLAAIVRERGLAGTTAGTVATAAAGSMDVLAWLVLAAALIGTRQSGRFSWPLTLLLTGCFVVLMLTAVRPALFWWTSRSQSLLSDPVVLAFALALASAWVTTTLGLQPVFGGFLAGLAMRPRNGTPDADVVRSMEQAAKLLLPLFFIVTGLSLNIADVHGDAIILLALIVLIASAGKLGPAYAASRLSGLTPRESATVAALVNTRGLTELIALNVGLQAGLINQRLFTVLVLMALLTTLMTGPLLSVIRPARAELPAETMRLTNM